MTDQAGCEDRPRDGAWPAGWSLAGRMEPGRRLALPGPPDPTAAVSAAKAGYFLRFSTKEICISIIFMVNSWKILFRCFDALE